MRRPPARRTSVRVHVRTLGHHERLAVPDQVPARLHLDGDVPAGRPSAHRVGDRAARLHDLQRAAGAHADRDGDVVAGEQDRLLRHQRHPSPVQGERAQVARADLSAGAGEHGPPSGRGRRAPGHRTGSAPGGAGPSRPTLPPMPGRSGRAPAPDGPHGRARRRGPSGRRSTPTYGARSVLLTTSRSARSMPGPPLRATSPPPATSRTKIWASTSAGENVAVRLSPPDSTSTTSRGAKPPLEVLDGHQVGGHVVADRRVRARAGLDTDDPLLRQDAGRPEEPGVLVGVDVVGDHGELQRRRPAPGRRSR